MADNMKKLSGLLDSLRAERQRHVNAIEKIDSVFADLGIQRVQRDGRAPARKAGPGRPKRRQRTRRRFEISGTKSILDFVKKAGKGGASSSDISKQWKSEGRSGEPYVTLGQLVKTRKLKKKSIKGTRGSVYTA